MLPLDAAATSSTPIHDDANLYDLVAGHFCDIISLL